MYCIRNIRSSIYTLSIIITQYGLQEQYRRWPLHNKHVLVFKKEKRMDQGFPSLYQRFPFPCMQILNFHARTCIRTHTHVYAPARTRKDALVHPRHTCTRAHARAQLGICFWSTWLWMSETSLLISSFLWVCFPAMYNYVNIRLNNSMSYLYIYGRHHQKLFFIIIIIIWRIWPRTNSKRITVVRYLYIFRLFIYVSVELLN